MNEEIKKRWITALRSGEYKQGKGYLRIVENNQDKYCCLGVLCDLYSKETNTPWKDDGEKYYSFLGSFGALPDTVVNWAEISNGDRGVAVKLTNCNLAYLNDARQYTFEEIAKVIEENL